MGYWLNYFCEVVHHTLFLKTLASDSLHFLGCDRCTHYCFFGIDSHKASSPNFLQVISRNKLLINRNQCSLPLRIKYRCTISLTSAYVRYANSLVTLDCCAAGLRYARLTASYSGLNKTLRKGLYKTSVCGYLL